MSKDEINTNRLTFNKNQGESDEIRLGFIFVIYCSSHIFEY
jgi:hypothetical protein